jgi:hypothetical protein
MTVVRKQEFTIAIRALKVVVLSLSLHFDLRDTLFRRDGPGEYGFS